MCSVCDAHVSFSFLIIFHPHKQVSTTAEYLLCVKPTGYFLNQEMGEKWVNP